MMLFPELVSTAAEFRLKQASRRWRLPEFAASENTFPQDSARRLEAHSLQIRERHMPKARKTRELQRRSMSGTKCAPQMSDS
jgi:hypothetical protein